MTDIFVRRPQPSKRPIYFALGLIVLCVIGGSFYWLQPLFKQKTRAPKPPAPAHEAKAQAAKPAASAEAAGTAPSREKKSAPPAAATAPAVGAAGVLDEIRLLRTRDDLQGAREKGLAALQSATDATLRQEIEALAGPVSIDLVFSPRPMPEKKEYVVEPGDSLAKLAKKYNTTVECIQKGNRITGSNIRVGDRLRILDGVFSIEVNKTRNDLLLTLNGEFFKRYRVGTGEYGKTPIGAFKITEKLSQPIWWRPDGKAIPYGDPENVLGTHWLSLDVKGYGIHGTWEPDTIGKQASAGCIRLLNEDVEELYVLVPVGTPVTIQ